MKKHLLLISLFVLPLFLTGCTKKTTENTSAVPTVATSTTPQQNVFTTIKDAVTRQIALKCEYYDDQNQKIDTYIKGQQVYMESTQQIGKDGKTALVKGIIKDDKFYVWGDGDNKGLVIDLTVKKEGDSTSMGGKQVKSVDDVINILEEKKDSCSATTFPESKFTVPTDVTFQAF